MKMKQVSKYTKVLHVFSQYSWHDDLMIVGDKEGLIALREAIDKAIKGKWGQSRATVNDGEEFGIMVGQLHSTEVDDFQTPYVADYAHSTQGTDPFDYFRQLRHW